MRFIIIISLILEVQIKFLLLNGTPVPVYLMSMQKIIRLQVKYNV